ILDPAPVPPKGLPVEVLEVDLLVPNQSEAEAILRLKGIGRLRRTKRADAKQIAGELLARGPQAVVLKLGNRGAMAMDHQGRIETIKPLKVKIVDSTAAGDAFAGTLAVALSEGKPLTVAVRLANVAGALCCEAFGAQPALPTRDSIEQRL